MTATPVVSALGWQRHPGALVCDIVCATDAGYQFAGTRPWQALCQWLRFHGLEPDTMPAENLITRDVEHCRIVYVGFVLDADGQRCRWDGRLVQETMVQQGETPPMPWPAELYAPNGAAQ